jgi:hypothetical protein
LGTLGSSGSFCALGKQVSWHLQNGILSLSRRSGLLLFDRAAGALPREGVVISARPLFSMGREASWHQQNNKVWSLGYTCVYGSWLLALSSKCAHGAAKLAALNHLVEALGSTYVGLLVSRSHRSCYSDGRAKPVGCRSPEAYLLAQATRSHGCCCRQGGIKPSSNRSSWACLPGLGSRRQYSSAEGTGEPSLLACPFPLPMVISRSSGSCLYRGTSFPGVSG